MWHPKCAHCSDFQRNKNDLSTFSLLEKKLPLLQSDRQPFIYNLNLIFDLLKGISSKTHEWIVRVIIVKLPIYSKSLHEIKKNTSNFLNLPLNLLYPPPTSQPTSFLAAI